MKYEIIVQPLALRQMDDAYTWLLTQTAQHAPLWYNGLLDALNSLDTNPTRCPLAPESNDTPEEVRQLLYGNKQHAYRILFAIRNDKVMILSIIHAARKMH